MKFVLILVLLAALITFLSFIGPRESPHPFWKMIFRLRRVIDSVCYAMFNVMAFLGILKGIHDVLVTPINASLFIQILIRTGGLALIALFTCTIFYSLSRFIKND